MLNRNYKVISSLALVTTILLASIAPVLAQTANVKIADSKPTSKLTSSSNDRGEQACTATKIQEYVSKLGASDLSDPNKLGASDLSDSNLEALVKCSAQAVPAVSKALTSKDTRVRAFSAYALGQIGSEAYMAVPALIKALQDKDDDVRSVTASALGKIGDKARAAVPKLASIYKNSDESSVVRNHAAQALEEIGTKEAITVLNATKLVINQTDRPKEQSAPHIRQSSESSCLATEEIIKKLGAPNLTSSDFECLMKDGTEKLPSLALALNSKNSDVRASAAYALGEIGVEAHSAQPFFILKKREPIENNPEVLRVINSYHFDACVECWDSITERKKIQFQATASPPMLCSLPGIRRIFPRCK